MSWSPLILLAAGLAACTVEGRDKPAAPDMTALVDGYGFPSRSFDEQAAIEVQNLVEQKVKKLVDFEALEATVEDALASLGEDDPPMAFAPTRESIVLEGEGFAQITRICGGFGTPTPPVDKDTNGYLALTVGYDDGGLDPVVFATAAACKEEVAGKQLEISGAINLYVGDNLRIDQVAESPIIFQLADSSFRVDGEELVDGGFDFQICRGTDGLCVAGSFELLLGLESHTTLVFFFDLANRTGGFRAANGVWTCDFAAGQCSDASGGTVSIPGYNL